MHSKVEVVNNECGHTFTAKLNNILDGATVCGVCGPKKRAATALKHYVAKYGRDYDLSKWSEYRRAVWVITNRNYKQHKAKLNPKSLPRKKAGAHPDAVNVDHLIPMIYGFKNGIAPEIIGELQNLRVVPAAENLSKKQKLTEEAEQLLKHLYQC